MLSTSLTVTVADARARGMRVRPRVGGFPHLAEALRQAGITAVHCGVASMVTVYRMPHGAVTDQGEPLVRGLTEVAPFDVDALVTAIRRDQRGESDYPAFMEAIWRAGVVAYDVDLEARTCTYLGIDGAADRYVEQYARVELARS